MSGLWRGDWWPRGGMVAIEDRAVKVSRVVLAVKCRVLINRDYMGFTF
jgi:hypothetical protein